MFSFRLIKGGIRLLYNGIKVCDCQNWVEVEQAQKALLKKLKH